MAQITLDLQADIASKFKTYIRLFGSKELMFDKFIDYHISRLKREIARMQKELNKYEEKYNLTTEEFYQGFDKGKFGDEKDYMLWAGVYELQSDSKNKLAEFV